MIQIAGVKTHEEAKVIYEAGATHIGFPLRLPVHKEDTTEEEARDIIKNLPDGIIPVLITYVNKAKEVSEFAKFLKTPIVQIHSEINVRELEELKKLSPSLQIIKSLVIKEHNSDELLESINDLSEFIDFFITDTFDPKTGASGATGKTHDWSISRQFVEVSTKPVILAGGLTPANVFDSIRTVNPFGVDTHTGVEDKLGNKDPKLVKDFIEEAKRSLALI
jgi:phosphoribosylanthranilate isomerase